MNKLVEIGEAIKRSNRVLLWSCHAGWRLFGVGACLGLTLEGLVKVIMGGPDPIPEIYHFARPGSFYCW